MKQCIVIIIMVIIMIVIIIIIVILIVINNSNTRSFGTEWEQSAERSAAKCVVVIGFTASGSAQLDPTPVILLNTFTVDALNITTY